MRDILVVVVVLGFTSVALFRPFVGVLLFAWLGFFVPQSYAWDWAKNIPLSQIAAIATIAGYFNSGESKKFPLTREAMLLLGLWAVFGISTVFAIYPSNAADRFIYVSKILLMVFLTIPLVKDKSRLDTLLRVIAFSLGFVAVKGSLFVIATGGEFLVWGPEGSFLEANNSIGLALAMNLPLLYYLLRIETRPWLRKVIVAMFWASYPAIICTYSRGAWIGLGVVTVLIFLKSKHKFSIGAALGLLVVVGGSAASILVPENLVKRYDSLVNYDQDDSSQSRLWSWEFCKRVGLARPLTGGGFNFATRATHAQYYPEFLDRWPDKNWSCHSSWFSVFGDHGFPGFFLWMALLFSCISTLRRLRAYGKAHPEHSWLCLYADAIQAAFVGYMVVGTFLDAAYFDMLYYLIGTVCVAKQIVATAPENALSFSSAPATLRRGAGAAVMLKR
jgi:probable O-glycosylation ligase (exosortase A-associated)